MLGKDTRQRTNVISTGNSIDSSVGDFDSVHGFQRASSGVLGDLEEGQNTDKGCAYMELEEEDLEKKRKSDRKERKSGFRSERERERNS